MSHFVSTRWRGDEREPSLARLRDLLSELAAQDGEHPCISLTHESGWSLSAYPSGRLIWENVEAYEPRHMNGIQRGYILELWAKLAEGRIEEIEAAPWAPGYMD